MANHKSAKKRIVRNEKRRVINKDRVSSIRTFIRKVVEATQAGNYEAAREALRLAQPQIQRAADKGILHANTASRKISRLAAKIKLLKA